MLTGMQSLVLRKCDPAARFSGTDPGVAPVSEILGEEPDRADCIQK